MSEIRVQYMDFHACWPHFDPHDNLFTTILKKYDTNNRVRIVDRDPTLIIYTCFGNEHAKYPHVRRVFYTGENVRPRPDADANLSFDYSQQYNNLRLPLWLLYDYTFEFKPSQRDKFCAFVYSNNITFRNNLCKAIGTYRPVDGGGSCLNTIGEKIENKIGFQSQYKFAIACENSTREGYTTEKILEAYKSGCIPIYFGSPTIATDFNPSTFIHVRDFTTSRQLIEYIHKVDTDPDEYAKFFREPIFSKRWQDIFSDPGETYFKSVAKHICPDLFTEEDH